jgi:beta-galactosidase
MPRRPYPLLAFLAAFAWASAQNSPTPGAANVTTPAASAAASAGNVTSSAAPAGSTTSAPAPAFTAAPPENPRLRENFDFGWRFLLGDPKGAEQTVFADSAWQKLALPHDWSIAGPFDENAPGGGRIGYLPTGIGWYRKHFTVPTSLRDKTVWLDFDGIYMNSDVWLNGHHLGHWPYGFSSFQDDLTQFLNYGAQPNVLAVRVDNSKQPAARWYTGSGMDRNVWINAADSLHVSPWGVYVTTPAVTADTATVRAQTHVQNDESLDFVTTVVSQVLDDSGRVLAENSTVKTIYAGGGGDFDQQLALPQPRLWSPDTPNLYRLRTLVNNGDGIVDEVETPFGVRTIAFDAERGFLLNGQPVKLLGMCLHQDAGAVGSAVPAGVYERRLLLLKAMGVNALRMSHNPPAPELLDLCDRLGFLVMDEAFDEWLMPKAPRPQPPQRRALERRQRNRRATPARRRTGARPTRGHLPSRGPDPARHRRDG